MWLLYSVTVKNLQISYEFLVSKIGKTKMIPISRFLTLTIASKSLKSFRLGKDYWLETLKQLPTDTNTHTHTHTHTHTQQKISRFVTVTLSWRRGLVVITTTQLHSIKTRTRVLLTVQILRAAYWRFAMVRSWLRTSDWPRLEKRLNAFRRSTISQKHRSSSTSLPLFTMESLHCVKRILPRQKH